MLHMTFTQCRLDVRATSAPQQQYYIPMYMHTSAVGIYCERRCHNLRKALVSECCDVLYSMIAVNSRSIKRTLVRTTFTHLLHTFTQEVAKRVIRNCNAHTRSKQYVRLRSSFSQHTPLSAYSFRDAIPIIFIIESKNSASEIILVRTFAMLASPATFFTSISPLSTCSLTE
jgi:hypothetical protein